MKSLDELKDLREKAQKDIQNRDTSDKVEIIVGMGTCGIAAGARNVLQEIMKELNKRDLDVLVSQTGCIGMCEKEPLVDVKLPAPMIPMFPLVGLVFEVSTWMTDSAFSAES